MPHEIQAGSNGHPLFQTQAVWPYCTSGRFLPKEMHRIRSLTNTGQLTAQLMVFYGCWNVATHGDCEKRKRENQQWTE